MKVLGSTAEPLAGVPVTVTRTGFTRNLTTTSDGCAFFAFVPPDVTYTVTLGAVGYVDRQGAASPSQVAGVTSGATSSVAFDYDQAASLTLTLTAPDGGSFPSTLSTVGRQHRAASRPARSSSRAPGAIRTVGNLFPYDEGYSRLGRRAAPTPTRRARTATALAYWDGATRDDRAADPARRDRVRRRQPADGRGALRRHRGRRPGRVDVVAVHDADNGCPTGLQYTVATFSGRGERARRAAVRRPGRFTVPGHTPLVRRHVADGHARPAHHRQLRRERGHAVIAPRPATRANGGCGEQRPDALRGGRGHARSSASCWRWSTQGINSAGQAIGGTEKRLANLDEARILMAVVHQGHAHRDPAAGGDVAVHARRQARGDLLRQPQQRRLERLGGRTTAPAGCASTWTRAAS